jgi:hypothetical protein
VRSFTCPTCAHLVFFENFACLNCGTQLGFARVDRELVAVVPGGLVRCANADVAAGHADGVVTLDLAEGDDGHREALRVQLAEPYRTLLGHLRHETGHWYWDVLVAADPEPFRAMFGDERADYGAALERHYSSAPPVGWENSYVSTYATAHPWEDWAESFAHYLHIRDTLQTAAAFGLVDGQGRSLPVRPERAGAGEAALRPRHRDGVRDGPRSLGHTPDPVRGARDLRRGAA